MGQSRGTAEQWAQLLKGVGKWKILQCNLVLKERSPLWDSEVEEKLAPFEELWNRLLSRSQRKSNEEESGRRYSHLKKPYVSSFSHWETMEKQNKKKLEFMIFDLLFHLFSQQPNGAYMLSTVSISASRSETYDQWQIQWQGTLGNESETLKSYESCGLYTFTWQTDFF